MSRTTRIAKNTLMLYFRQIITMLVGLYTVRIKLDILGIEDFGIFSVVGGVVALFTFLNSAMTSSTQRFLNFALGQNDIEQARKVYSASFIIHALIALLFIVLAQTVGLWFFHTWLNIPPERQIAAAVVYQFSIVATVIGILQVPYRATIIAYEKMSFFAKLSIIEVSLRLGIVFLLPIIMFDKLMVYAFLVCFAGIIIFLICKVYCNRTFETARFRYCRDKELFRQLLGFSGWSTFGSFANVSRTHATNILMNIFHGVTVNAAMGIATQVNSAVYQFVSNFQTAFNPQIVKSYSAKEYNYFIRLIFRTSKASFCLLFFFVLPLFLNTDFVLQIWLGNVPEYAAIFTRLTLLFSLLTAISGPLWMSIQATGDIKMYKLIASCFSFSILPLSFLVLWMGLGPVWVLKVKIIVIALSHVWRVFFLRRKIKLPVWGFFCEVIIPIFIIMAISTFLTTIPHGFLAAGWSRLIISCIISSISVVCLSYWIGLNKQEKCLLQNSIKAKIKKGNGNNSKRFFE